MSSREQFEAWASDEGKFPFVVERSGDSYKFMATQNKWEVWQAATSALEAKCAALAAENGHCKFEISRCHQAVTEMFENPKKWIDKEWLSSIWSSSKRLMEETQATDAFLAEVRAQGVNAAIEHLSKKFEGTGRIGVPVMALEWLEQAIRSPFPKQLGRRGRHLRNPCDPR